MDKGKAIVGQQFLDLAEILIEMADADMLHHADGGDAVERTGQFAIVDLSKFDAIGNIGLLCPHSRRGDLFFGHIDTGDVHIG